MPKSGCVFGTGPVFEVGRKAEREAGLGGVAAIREAFELGFEGDAEHVNIAEMEAGAEDKAGAGAEAVPEPRSVAELGLVEAAYETSRKLSSGAAVAWGSGVSLGAVFDPMVGVVLVVASETEDMVAPFEDTQGARSELLAWAQLGATVVEPEPWEKPETVEFDPFVEGMVGELDASAVQWAALDWVPTAGMENDPGGNLVVVL